MKLRLDKYLSNMGRGSRNEIKDDIRRGRVLVNGRNAKSGSQQVDTEDTVVHCGERVYYIPYVYLMLNKPEGYVSATQDQVHPTVIDLVPEKYRHYELFPVGRLDVDTTGLLLITNDGDFAHRVVSPVSGVEKVYDAKLSAPIGEEAVRSLYEGVEIFTKQGRRICRAKEVAPHESGACISITEGKFHQVKKMFEAVGVRVLQLRRIRIGGLLLDGALEPGQMRELDNRETESIFQHRENAIEQIL
ncbi:MAG: pseudouridine synthase [Bacillota bacterium]|nr:pseudouridine synthase [Bacillota bacterium]